MTSSLRSCSLFFYTNPLVHIHIPHLTKVQYPLKISQNDRHTPPGIRVCNISGLIISGFHHTDPPHHRYVLAAAAGSFFVNTLHASLTSKARKASGIKYPIAYASNEVADKDPKAYAFNCGEFGLLLSRDGMNRN